MKDLKLKHLMPVKDWFDNFRKRFGFKKKKKS